MSQAVATALLLVVFPFLMAYAAASDLFTMTIPNRISLALVAAFGVLAATGAVGWSGLLVHLGAGLGVLALTFGMFAAGWIGGGDAKLAAATALWLGIEGLGDYLVLASLGGGLLTLALLAARGQVLPRFAAGWAWAQRLHDQKTGIPYGIALAGAALAALPGSALWTTALGG
jgi:prepilin peptidase CpaA